MIMPGRHIPSIIWHFFLDDGHYIVFLVRYSSAADFTKDQANLRVAAHSRTANSTDRNTDLSIFQHPNYVCNVALPDSYTPTASS
jgi:hypothetical protein